jgi:MoaA/NifB/PqqE/SkfB family radical SAM enzyme
MKASRPGVEPQFYSGAKALPMRLKFAMSLGKYLLQRKKYPLFALKSSQGGMRTTRRILNDLHICKAVKYGKHYYFGLTTPRWPSQPFDRMAANGGLNIAAAGTPQKRQIDIAILAITRKCTYKCKHCYEHYNLGETDVVPRDRWKEVIKSLQQIGVSVITISGGEPMLRHPDVIELLEGADKRLSDFHLHTSGYGVTRENSESLKNAGLAAAAVGLDDINPLRHDELRGYEGAHAQALRAIQFFHEAGLFTYVNMCLTKELVRSGDLGKYYDWLNDLGVGIVRFLEPKPCGGYLWNEADGLFSKDDRKAVTEFFERASSGRKYEDYPLISYEAYYEAPHRLGCLMGGLSHLQIDSLGNVGPCVFLPVSFGNILVEDFSNIYLRMKNAIPRPFHGECPSIFLAEAIKRRKARGATLPIPYGELEKEWALMIQKSTVEDRNR